MGLLNTTVSALGTSSFKRTHLLCSLVNGVHLHRHWAIAKHVHRVGDSAVEVCSMHLTDYSVP
jgi:hypothetical protein